MEKRSFLDTHLIIWLFANRQELLSPRVIEFLENSQLVFSPIVKLELTYLREIKRINYHQNKILDFLAGSIDLKEDRPEFSAVINESLSYKWTRDPFDRILVANAALYAAPLLTRDKTILKNYKAAVW